jgi:hypothetical protein
MARALLYSPDMSARAHHVIRVIAAGAIAIAYFYPHG